MKQGDFVCPHCYSSGPFTGAFSLSQVGTVNIKFIVTEDDPCFPIEDGPREIESHYDSFSWDTDYRYYCTDCHQDFEKPLHLHRAHDVAEATRKRMEYESKKGKK